MLFVTTTIEFHHFCCVLNTKNFDFENRRKKDLTRTRSVGKKHFSFAISNVIANSSAKTKGKIYLTRERTLNFTILNRVVSISRSSGVKQLFFPSNKRSIKDFSFGGA
mgnify:CR=1 FL=1